LQCDLAIKYAQEEIKCMREEINTDKATQIFLGQKKIEETLPTHSSNVSHNIFYGLIKFYFELWLFLISLSS
jgi:hypothetical protein